jgi:hypothetical protein
MKPVDKFELNRMIHARAQELHLPGSPSGQSGHPQLHRTAQSVFGVKSFSDLSIEQMRKLYDHLDSRKRLPAKGEV